jgi:hypothetical protein
MISTSASREIDQPLTAATVIRDILLASRVIFVDISAGRVGLSSSEMEARGCPLSICA